MATRQTGKLFFKAVVLKVDMFEHHLFIYVHRAVSKNANYSSVRTAAFFSCFLHEKGILPVATPFMSAIHFQREGACAFQGRDRWEPGTMPFPVAFADRIIRRFGRPMQSAYYFQRCKALPKILISYHIANAVRIPITLFIVYLPHSDNHQVMVLPVEDSPS